jgi:hypothetical protein
MAVSFGYGRVQGDRMAADSHPESGGFPSFPCRSP